MGAESGIQARPSSGLIHESPQVQIGLDRRFSGRKKSDNNYYYDSGSDNDYEFDYDENERSDGSSDDDDDDYYSTPASAVCWLCAQVRANDPSVLPQGPNEIFQPDVPDSCRLEIAEALLKNIIVRRIGL
jgi:hypothetical protein